MKTFVVKKRTVTFETYQVEAENFEQAEQIVESGEIDPVHTETTEDETLSVMDAKTGLDEWGTPLGRVP